MVISSTDPFKVFNDLKGKLTVIAARPGVESPRFLVDIINNCNGRKVLFNLESAGSLFKDKIPEDAIEFIISPMMIEEIRKMCEAMSKLKLSLVLIDYLQLVGTERIFDNFVEEQTFIVKELKNIAVDFNVSVIVLSMLPKYIDQREDKIPRLNDVKTYVRFTADVILFLCKDNFFPKLIVAKNYNERLSNIRLGFDNRSHSFRFLGSSEERLSFMSIFNENYY